MAERPEREAPTAPAAALDRDPADRLAAERSAEPPAPLPDPMQLPAPESYTRELSGLRGRVVEEDGSPVPDKKVELLRIHPDVVSMSLEDGFAPVPKELIDPVFDETRTDAEGRFQLGDVEVNALALLGIDLGGPRGTIRVLDVALERGQVHDLGDVILPPHVTFTGTVNDEDGVPVASARVRVLPQIPLPIPPQALQVGVQDIRADSAALVVTNDDSTEVMQGQMPRMVLEMPGWLRAGFERVPIPTTATDGEGRFRLPGIPAGVVTLLVDKPGLLGLVRGGQPTGRRAEQDLGTIVLPAGRTMTGRALAGETPVAGARVLVGATIPLPIDEFVTLAIGQPAGVTAADGSFSLSGLPVNGDLLCAIERQSGDPWTLLGPFQTDEVTLELPAVADLAIEVVDPAGNPVEHAELRFRDWSQIQDIPFFFSPRELRGRVHEEGGGRYRARELAIGTWVVLARAPGFGVGKEQVELGPDGASVRVALKPARTIGVRVTAAGDGSPVEHALVAAHANERGIGPMPYKTTRSDVAGTATLTQLPASEPLHVRASHPGYAVGVERVDAAAEGTSGDTTVELALLRGGDLAGVVRVAGEPPTKPLMIVLNKRGSNSIADLELPRLAITAPDGSYRIRHLVPGEWRWLVYPRFFAAEPIALMKTAMDEPDELAQGQCEIVEGVETRLDIDAQPETADVRGIVRGRVTVDGATLEGLDVQLSGRRRFDSTQTDASGRFEFTERRSGEYTIEIVRDDDGGRATLGSQQFVLQPGETKELDLDLRTTPVRVRVTLPGGEPVGGVSVTAFPQPSEKGSQSSVGFGSATTADDGTATLTLAPGRWRFGVEDEQRGRVSATIEVAAQGQDTVHLELDPGVVVSGRFELDVPSADPDDRWYLSLVRQTDEGFDSGNWTPHPASKREFEFHAVTPGRYRLQVFANDGGMRRSEEFEVTRAGARDLVLRFEKE